MPFNCVNKSSSNPVAREELEPIIPEAHQWCGRDITDTLDPRLREISAKSANLLRQKNNMFLKTWETSLPPDSILPLKDDKAFLKYADKAKECLTEASRLTYVGLLTIEESYIHE